MKQIFLNFLWVVLISSVSIAANSTGREGENDVLQNDNKTKKHSSFKKRVPYCYMIKIDKSNEIISKSIISVKSGSILENLVNEISNDKRKYHKNWFTCYSKQGKVLVQPFELRIPNTNEEDSQYFAGIHNEMADKNGETPTQNNKKMHQQDGDILKDALVPVPGLHRDSGRIVEIVEESIPVKRLAIPHSFLNRYMGRFRDPSKRTESTDVEMVLDNVIEETQSDILSQYYDNEN